MKETLWRFAAFIFSRRPVAAYTLFFTWGQSQGWGFKVGDRVVPWREYLGEAA